MFRVFFHDIERCQYTSPNLEQGLEVRRLMALRRELRTWKAMGVAERLGEYMYVSFSRFCSWGKAWLASEWSVGPLCVETQLQQDTRLPIHYLRVLQALSRNPSFHLQAFTRYEMGRVQYNTFFFVNTADYFLPEAV